MEETGKYITYIFVDDEGTFTTFTQPLLIDDKEHDAAPNMKFFVSMIEGDSPKDAQDRARHYIRKLQLNETLTPAQIRKMAHRKVDGSYIRFPDGSQVDIIPGDA